MYLCKDTDSMLNEVLNVIQGPAACFKIQYWGVALFDNISPISILSLRFVISWMVKGNIWKKMLIYPLRAGTHFCSRPGINHQIRTKEGLFIVYVAFELDETQSDDTMREAFSDLAEHAEVCIYEADHRPTAHLWKSLLIQEGKRSLLPAAFPACLRTSGILLFHYSEKTYLNLIFTVKIHIIPARSAPSFISATTYPSRFILDMSLVISTSLNVIYHAYSLRAYMRLLPTSSEVNVYAKRPTCF